MRNLYKEKIRLLTNLLVKNAAYLGLSESTIQNMLQSAFESNPGLKIMIKHKGDKKLGKKCKYNDRMPHHPLPNCVRYENKTSKLDMIGAIFGTAKRLDKGVRTM
jgi:capsule polysaccharide export protein KpsC/LpsZ